MRRVVSTFIILIGLTSVAYSTTTLIKDEPSTYKKVNFNLPHIKQQERDLNNQLRTRLLEASRDFSLKQCLETIKFINLLDMYEAKIWQMRCLEKQKRASVQEASKLWEDCRVLREKVNHAYKSFHTNVFLPCEEKINEAQSQVFYLHPIHGSLELDHSALPENFFPLHVFFLKPKEERSLLFTGEEQPKELELSKLLSMGNCLSRSPHWSYPEDTYKYWVLKDDSDEWDVAQTKWTSAFVENL